MRAILFNPGPAVTPLQMVDVSRYCSCGLDGLAWSTFNLWSPSTKRTIPEASATAGRFNTGVLDNVKISAFDVIVVFAVYIVFLSLFVISIHWSLLIWEGGIGVVPRTRRGILVLGTKLWCPVSLVFVNHAYSIRLNRAFYRLRIYIHEWKKNKWYL